MNTKNSNHPIIPATDREGNPIWIVNGRSFKSLQVAESYRRELEDAERELPLPLIDDQPK